MDLKEREIKFAELMKDEENVKALLAKVTPEEAQAWLKERGLEYSIEELNEMCDALKDVAEGTVNIDELKNSADKELSDDELESAAGGSVTLAVTGIAITAAAAVIAKYLDDIDWPSW